MTASTQATVEVLTAEVRVLMVGSRQITLSVARQLDEVDPGDIVPFGRITTGRKRASAEETMAVEVIGRCVTDGSLTRSLASGERNVCGRNFRPGSRYVFRGMDAAASPCDKHRHPSLEMSTADEPHLWVWYYPDAETVRAWQELPLIVLAGLR